MGMIIINIIACSQPFGRVNSVARIISRKHYQSKVFPLHTFFPLLTASHLKWLDVKDSRRYNCKHAV